MTAGDKRRIVLLAEGRFSVLDSKTAACVVRYRPDEVVAIIDSTKAGRTAQDVLGFGGQIPVVESLASAAAYSPDTLLIGIAPRGGGLPEDWRPIVLEAVSRGLDVISGLHYFLSEDPEISELARRKGVRLIDLRRVPEDVGISTCKAGSAQGHVVLTVGSDCNVGKMTATMEIVEEARRRGIDCRMLATGQTGIYLAGGGMAVDRCVADFVAGAAERLVLDSDAPGRWLVLEGQGSLTHPAYSGVALGLLHGAMPECMVLCHQATRTKVAGYDLPLPPLEELIELHERLASYVRPSKVVAVCLNCFDLSDSDAEKACRDTEERTGLPTVDPVRHGAGRVVEAIDRHLRGRSV